MTKGRLRARDESHLGMKAARLKLVVQQCWRCHWCGCLMCDVPGCPNQATLDHVQPVHAGGRSRAGNYVAACRRCNSERHPEVNRTRVSDGMVYASAGDDSPRSPFEVLRGRV